MPAYWASELAEELSQGDLLEDAWIGASVSPRKALKKATGKGGKIFWDESVWTEDANQLGHFLARGRRVHALVLSQSCEIDKAGGSLPVLVAPVFPLSIIQDASLRDRYRKGERYAFMPLDELPGVVSESYVDLRTITYVPRAIIDAYERKGSATDAGALRLSTQLVAFFTRIPMDKIVVNK